MSRESGGNNCKHLFKCTRILSYLTFTTLTLSTLAQIGRFLMSLNWHIDIYPHLQFSKCVHVVCLATGCDSVHFIPFAVLVAAHAKFLGAGLHAATHHQPISRLKDVQGAGNPGVGHGANKYRDVLGKTAEGETEGESVRRPRYGKIPSLDCIVLNGEVPTWTVQPSQHRAPVSSQPTARGTGGS